eukprot:3708704-Prymnesium_polylepis.5
MRETKGVTDGRGGRFTSDSRDLHSCIGSFRRHSTVRYSLHTQHPQDPEARQRDRANRHRDAGTEL